MKKKILIVSQYFWPESFRINDLAVFLAEKPDLEIDVLTGLPNYPSGKIDINFLNNKKKFSKLNNVNILRVPMISRKSGTNFWLSVNYFSFLVSSIFFGYFKLKKKNYDCVFTFATSPILVALTSIFFSKIKNCSNILWVQDLWPHVLVDLKIVKKNGFLYNLSKYVINFIYKNSTLVLCQSLSFKKIISKEFPDSTKKLIYCPGWSEEINVISKVTEENWLKFDTAYLNIVFTGNIGEAQNIDLIINLIKKNINEKIKWYFVGGGRNIEKLKSIKSEYKLANLIIYDFMPFENIQAFFKNADLLLIILKPGLTFSSTIPGKFQTYLKYQKFIFGLVSGEVNKIINKYQIGLATSSQDVDEISNILKNIYLKKYETGKILVKKENFIRVSKLFSKKRLLDKLYQLIFKCSSNKDTVYVLDDIQKINLNENFVLSALNLAWLAHYASGDIKLFKEMVLWPDGFFKKTILKSNDILKLPGYQLITEIKIDKNIIKKIIVIGNLSNISKLFLENKFQIPIEQIELPFGNYKNLINFLPNLDKDALYLLTLPTPKQELIAEYLRQNNKYFKIICIGGGLAIASGVEKKVPEFLKNFIFGEALWRLRYETKRRLFRLLKTFHYYFIGTFFNKFKKLNVEIYDKKK